MGIYAPKAFTARIEVRWFDQKRFRMGGVFMKISRNDQMVIDQIIQVLRERAQARLAQHQQR